MSIVDICTVIGAVIAVSTTIFKFAHFFIDREVRLRVIEEKVKDRSGKTR